MRRFRVGACGAGAGAVPVAGRAGLRVLHAGGGAADRRHDQRGTPRGTLGLLFLTDLKGHDIVFGKLAASSVNALYSLLAIVPVLGLTLLFGGVSGTQFWRSIWCC